MKRLRFSATGVALLALAACNGGGEGPRAPSLTPSTTNIPAAEKTMTLTAASLPASNAKLIFIRGLAQDYPLEGVLWISNFDGSQARQMTPEGVPATFVGLTGSKAGSPILYYLTRDNERTHTLWQLDLASQERASIVSFQAGPYRPGRASVSPDGRYVAYSHGDGLDLLDLETGEGRRQPYWDEAGRYHHFGPTDLGSLADERGTALRATIGTGVTGQSDILGVELPPGTGQYLPVFDLSQIDGPSSETHLRFTVSLAEFISEGSEPPVVEIDNQNISLTGQTLSIEPLGGPFTFEFALPRAVDDGR